MKKIMKVTAVLNIIFGLHYLVLALIALSAAGEAALASLATLSLSIIGGTFGIILLLAFCAGLAIVYGMGGIWTLKNDKKKALICMFIAAAVAFISLVIAIIHTKIKVSFVDVMALILPAVHGFLIIQTED